MSAEIIDQANELAERRLEMTIQNMRINHAAVSATHCRDCGEEIPERRRELVAGCQRCACKKSLKNVVSTMMKLKRTGQVMYFQCYDSRETAVAVKVMNAVASSWEFYIR
jgi:phage/conjugal plasmid C-4 type zinc finger TraR family protein